MRNLKALMVVALAIVVMVPGAIAQGTGGLTIRVIDENGDPLPAATVTLSHETGNIKAETSLTNKNGEVIFPVLRAGSGYIVEVSFPGLGTRREPGVRVAISEQTLKVVSLSTELIETVSVTARENVVDLEKSSQSSKFSDDFIQDLPVQGNAYQNVLTLAPGVNDSDGDGNPTVHGSRARDFKTVVSGVSNVDPLTGEFFSNVNPNSIEEMEVITGGASVALGGAQGGFANIIQKQGTNEFEGVIDFLYNSDLLDGEGANDFNRLEDADFQRIDAGISFSGPILRDKVWFFLAHNFIDRDDPLVTASGTDVITTKQGTIADSVTWQASPRNKFTFKYQADPLEVVNANLNAFNGPESTFSRDDTTDTVSVSWDAPYSTKIFINSVMSFQENDVNIFPTQTGVRNTCLPDDPNFGGLLCTDLQTGLSTGSFSQTFDSTTERFNLKADATIFAGQVWGASHEFKMGAEFTNERYFFTNVVRPTSFYQEVIFDPEDDDGGTPERIRTLTTTLTLPDEARRRATSNRFSLYIEDQIKPLANLTLTVGARVDREQANSNGLSPFTPTDEVDTFFNLYNECLANGGSPGPCSSDFRQDVFTAYELISELPLALNAQLPQISATEFRGRLSSAARDSESWGRIRGREDFTTANTNISPFFSFKWDPWNNGKTAFGGTYRRYYNNLFLLIPLQELLPPTTQLSFRVQEVPNPDFNPLDPNETDPQFLTQAGALRRSIETAVNLTVVDRDLKTPYQDEFTLSFERELFTETALRLSYTRRDYKDQFQDRNLNKRPGDFGRCIVANPSNTATITAAPGTGELVNPYTGEIYFDDDPGVGDGIIDDCAGLVERNFGAPPPADEDDLFTRTGRVERPDGIPDLYIQNPAFGDLFLIGNNNEATYEGITVELTRRQYRSWEMQGSYTWSMNRGDGEDFNQAIVGDDPTLDENIFGFQSNDIRHVVNVSATTITPWGVRVGGVARWQSGLPYSVLEQRLSFDQPITQIYPSNSGAVRTQFVTGRRNDQRNAPYWNFDLKATKEFSIGRRANMQLSAQVFNLLNDDTEIIYNNFTDTGQRINGQNQSFYRFGRQWEIGAKIAF